MSESNCTQPEQTALLKGEYSKLLNLVEAANNLNSIVEGIPSERWECEGRRLKDTLEWAQFYVSLAAVNDETAARNAIRANTKPR